MWYGDITPTVAPGKHPVLEASITSLYHNCDEAAFPGSFLFCKLACLRVEFLHTTLAAC